MNYEKVEFSDGTITLYHGDAFDILPTLEDCSASALISDPPYSSVTFGQCSGCNWDMPVDLNRFWELAEQKTKPEANFVLFATMRFATDLINSRPKFFRYDLCWSKNTKCGFLWANHQPLRNHESILIFNRPGFFKKATYNALRTPGGRVGSRQISRTSNGVYGHVNSYVSESDGLLHPSSVLCFDSDRGNNNAKIHPTQKPLRLLQWLISAYTNPGDTVVDPFMGSGTTALACLMLGRKCVAIEREKEFFDIACKRLENYVETGDLGECPLVAPPKHKPKFFIEPVRIRIEQLQQTEFCPVAN